ncbi:hypothetical protein EZV62_009654 [Acer yangbiense]|uniref:Uncharacterized protein n=1 Tax=Acer yangbiense TaxID=1000413 RepID=A0A5C7I0J1_9ROSI|nr:hypothetical protein EZV62_009654 [Acer yangbiense]
MMPVRRTVVTFMFGAVFGAFMARGAQRYCRHHESHSHRRCRHQANDEKTTPNPETEVAITKMKEKNLRTVVTFMFGAMFGAFMARGAQRYCHHVSRSHWRCRHQANDEKTTPNPETEVAITKMLEKNQLST